MTSAANDRTTFRFFAVSAPGLEALLLRELVQLGAEARAVPGGVEGTVSRLVFWRIHRESALAESLRVRLKSFHAASFSALEAGLSKLPWHAYATAHTPLEVRVSCSKSRLYHSEAIVERVVRVVGERLRSRPDGARPSAPLRIHLRLERDVVTPSIDSSGELLHRRGYRQAVEAAPLRETLAAAMASLLDGLGGAPPSGVWDPFCGSGALPLEWLRSRVGIAPGARRRFAFERWPTHPKADYAAWKRAQDEEEQASWRTRAAGVHAWCSDVDEKAVRSAVMNATALLGEGMGDALSTSCGDFRQVAELIPAGTAIIGNPPHGKRIGNSQRSNKLYEALEALLVERSDLRPVVIACGHQPFVARALAERRGGLRWVRLLRSKQGGLPVSVLGLT